MPKKLSSATIYGPNDFDVVHRTTALVDQAAILGLDTEFTGLNYWAPDWRLRLVQFGHQDKAYVLDPLEPAQRAAIEYVLENTLELVTHDNADALSIHRGLGMDITDKIHDTKVMAQLVWPGPREEHALKPLCTRYLDDGLEQAEQDLLDAFKDQVFGWPQDRWHRPLSRAQKGRGFAEIPVDSLSYTRYAGLDANYVLHLHHFLETKLYETGTHKAYPDEQKIRAAATRMQMRGMRVDIDRANELLADYGSRHDAAQEEFFRKFFCLAKSPLRIDAVIASGVPVTTKTPKGNPSLGKATVEALAQEYPDSEPLQILQKVADTSNVTTFLRTLLSFVHNTDDGQSYVHPDFNTLGAVTGRWTVTDPAIQTVGTLCRSAFVPRPGHVLVSADLGQIEPRVAVALAGEMNLIPDLLQGSDVYSAGAALAFGSGYSDKQRKQIKRVVLGTLYASGVNTLVKQARLLDGWLDANHATVAEVRSLWKKAAPEIEAYSKYLQLLPKVVLDSGRWIPQEQGREYKAINSMCQGTARDALMERVTAMSTAGLDQYMVATLHDEILLDVPGAVLPEVIRAVTAVMEMGFNGIPTPTDIEIYPESWGSKGIPVEEYLA